MFINLILKDFVIKNKFNVMNILEKVEEASALGVKRLVIAPCYYDKDSKTSIEEVSEIVSDLNAYLEEKGEDIKLYPGNLIRDNYDNIKEFIDGTIGSINWTRYILLNTDESMDLKELIEVVYEFNLRNYTPIIVAPERMKEIISSYKNINKLVEEGCLFQLDIASINGEYGKEVLKTAKILKKKGFYNFIGFKDNIRKQEFKKDLEIISKKGLEILLKNKEIKNKEVKKTKKLKFLKPNKKIFN